MKLNGYDQIELITKGELAAVYRARQKALDRAVAIKILTRSLADVVGVRKRFERETQVIAGFSHPNIAHVFERGLTSAQTPYLITEFIPGQGLDRLVSDNTLTLTNKLRIAIQCAMALDYAHGKRIVHSDVRPGNVIIDLHGTARMLEFGVSELLAKPRSGTRESDAPVYLSPERARGAGLKSALSDIYSLGVFLYELHAGVRPAPGVDLSQVAQDLPPELRALTRNCMQQNPAERPRTVAEIRDVLLRVLSRIEAGIHEGGAVTCTQQPGREMPQTTPPAPVPPEQESGAPMAPPATAPDSDRGRVRPGRTPKSDYWIRQHREVVRILTQLSRESTTVTAHFNENKDFVLTTILGVMRERDLLVLDEGPNAKVNARLVEGEKVTCRTELHQVRIRFDCRRLSRARYKGRSAIVCPIPGAIFYLERRQFFRVATSVIDPPICYLPVEDKGTVPFTVTDISVGGVRLNEISRRLDLSPQRPREFFGCRLYLPDFAELSVNLQIRHVRQEQRKDGQEIQSIGAMFLDPSPATSSLVQRYVNRIQVTQIALSKQ